MARKRGGGGIGEIFLFGGILVFSLASVLLALLLTAVYYTFPLALLWWGIKSSFGEPPTQNETPEVDGPASLKKLRSQKKALEREFHALESRGLEEGVRYIDKEERFENRSTRGQQLNAELDSLRDQHNDLDNQIEIAKNPEHSRINLWLINLRNWYGGQAYRVTLIAAAFAFALAAVVTEVASLNGATWTGYHPVYRNPLPAVLLPSTFFGAMCGWAVGLGTLWFAKRHFQNKADHVIEALFEDDESEEELDESAQENADQNEEYEEKEEAVERSWEDVLHVESDATSDQIKLAYKDAIKKCHPDTVADRSDEIKKTAASEAQQINVAYQQARVARGF
jgi:hypothetical protein